MTSPFPPPPPPPPTPSPYAAPNAPTRRPKALGGVVLGGVLFAGYAVLAAGSQWISLRQYERTDLPPDLIRWAPAAPEVLLGALLLVVALLDRRWWQGPLAAVLMAGVGIVPSEFIRRIPTMMAEQDLRPDDVENLVFVVVVVAGCMFPLAWGLARRRGLLWLPALVMSWAAVIGGAFVARAIAETADSLEEFLDLQWLQLGVVLASYAVAIGLGWLAELLERPGTTA